MQFTSRLAIPSPQDADVPDMPAHFLNRANILDKASITDHGPLSNRPVSTPGSPGIKGRRYYAEDATEKVEYLDTGTSWVPVAGRLPASGLIIGDTDVTLSKRAAAQLGLNASIVTTRALSSDASLATFIAGDSDHRFLIRTSGELSWGSGAARDTNLYRPGASTLKTNNTFEAADVIRARAGNAEQLTLGYSGSAYFAGILFGSAGDTNLYRSAADTLQTDDNLYVAGSRLRLTGVNAELQLLTDGAQLIFGALGDVNLYRSAANELKTDDKLIVSGGVDVLGDNVHVQGVGGIYLGAGTDVRLYRAAAGVLRTNGEIQVSAAGIPVAAGVESLRMIRGTVNADGTIAQGSGFTVTKGAAGVYTINYSTAFPGAGASVTANYADGSLGFHAPTTNPAAASVGVTTSAVANGSAGDRKFSFIAIGPR